MVVFAVALALRLAIVPLFDGPGYLDAAANFLVGRELANGNGLTQPFIWHWLVLPEAITHPSNDYWPPLEPILVAGAMKFFGFSYPAALIPNAVLAALLPVIAYWLASTSGLDQEPRILAAMLAFTAGSYFGLAASTDPMVPFAVSGSLSLAFADRAGSRAAAIAGGFAGLAALARVDGVLLLAPLVVRAWRERSLLPAALAGAAFAVVVLPLAVRSLSTFGQMVPTGTSTLWLTEYNDMFRPGGVGFAEWAARGPVPILAEKLAALGSNALVVLFLGHLFLAPAAALGVARNLRRAPAAPVYLSILYLAMSLVFTYPGAHGGFAHSLAALIPAYAVAAADGIRVLADSLASLRRLKRAQARRVLAATAAVGSTVAAVGLALQLFTGWRDWRQELSAEANVLAKFGAADAVAVADSPTFAAVSGRLAVTLPTMALDDGLDLLSRYGVPYLLVGPAHPRGWAPLAKGQAPTARLTYLGRAGNASLFRLEH